MDKITKKKKVVIFGKGGQLGLELSNLSSVLGEVILVDVLEVDFTHPGSIRKKLMTDKPEVVINGAAYTQVDRAEEDSELVCKININALKEMSQCVKELDALLVHYSSDYVFDGEKKEPYVESDPTNPINFYGKSKVLGEEIIIASGCNHLLFRTSWLYSGYKQDFIEKITKLSEKQPELKVVNDQIGSPTWSRMVAEKTIEILSMEKAYRKENHGIYHLVSEGYTSWYEFAKEILRKSKVKIYPVSSEEFITIAKRPKNSRLNCQKVKETFGITLPNWRDSYHQFESECVGGK